MYAPSHCSFLSDVRINEILEWGIAPEKGSAIDLESCTKEEHGEHDFLASFNFSNAELLAFYEKIARGCDEARKMAIAERYEYLKLLSDDPKIGHENTIFHCSDHPIKHTNYKELDWTIRLYYSIKDQLDPGFSVKPS